MKRFAILVLLAACSGGSTSSPGPASGSQQPPSPKPSTDGTGAPAAIDPSALGKPCADGGTCGAGMECVKYYGVAGARGPQFATCEVRCSEKSTCPTGTQCDKIADGPGAVCRPH